MKMSAPIIKTETGALRGTIENDVNGKNFYAFRGIPYGKPTSDHARFKAPQPAQPWTGILQATKDGDACFSRDFAQRTLIGTENCLVLNVFTPTVAETTSKKPVMVFIHGGAFTAGSSNSQVYGPEFLVAEDVVLVTINYRLHVLGFLALEDASLDVPGNAGLKDMVLALKWVQRNIENFCGDPKNVTVFGESAGGAAVHYLILSPLAKGLFHKAIIQSGCALNPWAHGRRIAVELGQQLGLTTTNEKELLQHFRKIPVEELFEASEKLTDIFIASCNRPYGPVVEQQSKNAFLTEHPLDIIKSGKYNHVPVLIGYNTREGMLTIFRDKEWKPHSDFELLIPNTFHIDDESKRKLIAEKLKTFYYKNEEPSENNKDAFYLLESDNLFIIDILNSIIYHSQNAKRPIFVYRMSIDTELNTFKRFFQIKETGVAHADDMGYLFKGIGSPAIKPGSAEDIGRQRFCKIWSNFARYGHPNPKPDELVNVEWKPVTKDELHFVDIGQELTVGVNPEQERLAFWKDISEMCVSSD